MRTQRLLVSFASIVALSCFESTASGQCNPAEVAKHTALDGALNDNFGIIVAMDGDTAIVGAWGADTAGGSDAGVAGEALGYAVALSDDTAVVGAFSDDNGGGANAGAVYFLMLGCDDDGDGLINANDACPGNSPGVPVDATGRPLRDCNGDCAVNALDIQCIVDEMLNQ